MQISEISLTFCVLIDYECKNVDNSIYGIIFCVGAKVGFDHIFLVWIEIDAHM